MLQQVLDVLVIFTCLEGGLVVDANLDLGRILAILLTFAFIDIDRIKDTLIQFKSKLFACLNQLIRLCIH